MIQSSTFEAALRVAERRHFMHCQLWDSEKTYRDLFAAIGNLHALRWDAETDEPRLAAFEARCFRLMRTLEKIP